MSIGLISIIALFNNAESTSAGVAAANTKAGQQTLSLEGQPPAMDIHPEDLALIITQHDNNKITDLQARYNRARKVDRKSFCHTLCLQLVTTKGVRNMYYEYAYLRAEELEAIQEQLLSVGVLSDSEEEIDWDADC